MKKPTKITPERIMFYDNYGELDDAEILREILFTHHLQIGKLEKIRSNTSKLVWWLIVLPIILAIFIFFVGLAGLGF